MRESIKQKMEAARSNQPFRRPKNSLQEDYPSPSREWTRAILLSHSSHSCSSCAGSGRSSNPHTPLLPCNCVTRNIFRECLRRFRKCTEQAVHLGQTRYDRNSRGASNTMSYGRINENFIADFTLIAKRKLRDDEWPLFRLYYVLGLDINACLRTLKTDKHVFWHNAYRIQEKLGRAFYETQPYALCPLDEYFSQNREGKNPVSPCIIAEPPAHIPVVAPMQPVAA